MAQNGKNVACVAGGISGASAFVFAARPWATPWTRVAKPLEDWWGVELNFTRGFAAREFSRSPAREHGGSAARPLKNPASYVG